MHCITVLEQGMLERSALTWVAIKLHQANDIWSVTCPGQEPVWQAMRPKACSVNNLPRSLTRLASNMPRPMARLASNTPRPVARLASS